MNTPVGAHPGQLESAQSYMARRRNEIAMLCLPALINKLGDAKPSDPMHNANGSSTGFTVAQSLVASAFEYADEFLRQAK